MIVSGIGVRTTGDTRRVGARIEWESSARAAQTLFYDVGPDHTAPLTADPNAFLVAAILPAWHRGERRVRVEGSLCPMLVDQLRAPLKTLAAWYPELGRPPTIEAEGLEARPAAGDRGISRSPAGSTRWRPSVPTGSGSRAIIRSPSARACSWTSSTRMRTRRRSAPTPTPPRSTRPCACAGDVGAELVVLRTNLWSLDGDGWFFAKSSFGALFLSAAHCLSGAYRHVYIAASIDAQHPFVPAGSSPLLDPYYSSGHLQVHHHGTYMPRLERTALVSEWPVGLNNLRVCVHDERGTGNCGTCEKCIRTKLTLVALGKLHESAAFEEHDVDRELLQTVIQYRMIWVSNLRDAYTDLIPLLERRGRHDLVAGINAIVADFNARAAAGDDDIIPG